MNKISNGWTNGITLSLSKKDQDYISDVLSELGIKADYPVSKKSLGIFKVGFASKEADRQLLSYVDEVSEIMKGLLPLQLTAKEIELHKPWNTELKEVIWFKIDPLDPGLEKIRKVASELESLLKSITDPINQERNKSFLPHLTLMYYVTPEVVKKLPELRKNYLPFTFTLEHAEFYLSNDERVRID